MATGQQDTARRRKMSAWARVASAAWCAGATGLTSAFIPPSLNGLPTWRDRLSGNSKYNEGCVGSTFAMDGALRAIKKTKGGQLVRMSAAVAQSPPSRKLNQKKAAVRTTNRLGSTELVELHKNLPRKPSLTVEEERDLINKIHHAQVLRELRKQIDTGAAEIENLGGRKKRGRSEAGAVQVGVWAREAGIDVSELRRRLRDGVEARELLIERNMPMIFKIVQQQYRWRLHGGHVSSADLVQEGAYALGLAAERFDPAMENRFLTYAVFIVREKLDAALATGNMAVSVPVAALKEYYVARKELRAKLRRAPTESELETFFIKGSFDGAGPPWTTTTVLPTTGLKIASTIPGRGLSEVEIEAGMGAGVEQSAVLLDPNEMKKRKRRADLLAAVQKVTSLDSRGKDKDDEESFLFASAVERSARMFQSDPLSIAENDGLSALLPQVLTPRQTQLVSMACGLEDGLPRSMQDCADKLCLSVSKTKALFEASLQKLRLAAADGYSANRF